MVIKKTILNKLALSLIYKFTGNNYIFNKLFGLGKIILLKC